jgi:hypothetical protein
MHFDNLDGGEIVAVVGGVILGLAVFLTWYELGNANATLNKLRGPNRNVSAWEALEIMRFLLLGAAAAPLILAYIIIRDHALSWPRGELTAVVAIFALGLILTRGIIIKPGEPAGQISLGIGYWLAVVGGVLILVGALIRTGENVKARRPPGMP